MAALAFIVYLFCYLTLHCMTLLFAAFGYRVFTACPTDDNDPLTAAQIR
jgi:hypothetical protein